MRNNSRSLKQFTAHSGPAFSLDWHPEEKFWLATSGRDKTIKASLWARSICASRATNTFVIICYRAWWKDANATPTPGTWRRLRKA